MSASRIPLPQSLDLVPGEHVRSLIDATDEEISALERELELVSAAAMSAEAQIRDLGIDEGSSAWTMLRLQVFLDGLRAEAAREAREVLDLASRPRGSDHREVVVSPPVAPLLATPRANGRTPHPEPAQVAPAPVAFIPAVAPVAAAPLIDPAAVVFAPVIPEAKSEPTVEVPVIAAPAAPIVFTEPQVKPAPAQTEPARRSVIRRIPVSAILEVAAVLLILVFILLRLS